MSDLKSSESLNTVLQNLWRDTIITSRDLFKVTIPAVILTKILEELGLIAQLSLLLEPVMGLMGLPGSLGIVWATALITTPYSALAVFASISPGMDLSSGQVTVLCSVMLIAHSLPVELSISKKAGAGVIPMGALRLLAALGYGILLYRMCRYTGIWQEPVRIFFSGGGEEQTIYQWAVSQMFNLGLIFLVIFCILTAMHFLRVIGFLRLLEMMLKPILPIFGMTHRAAPVAVVGMIMGLGYGGALIIRETTTGSMDKREIFNSLALMGLSHGLIEDTLIMVAIGGKLWGILVGRLLFSLIVVFCINQLMSRLTSIRS